jgi:predicted O-linked N-acetylglucosamine transferase (SPINDLY family)
MSKRDEAQTLQLAFSLHRSGKFNDAAKLYRKIIKWNPRSIHALHSLGVIEAANGNLIEAARLMARSLSVQPTNIQFIENYATVLCQLGDYRTALDVSLKACSIDGTRSHLLYVSAVSFLKLRRLQDSLLQFDKILLQDPNHVAAMNERGTVLLEMKQYDAALASIEKAIALDPQFAEAHHNKGVLCGLLVRYDQAIAAFDKALALKPTLGQAWVGYGNCLSALHRHDEALIAYEKALSIDTYLDGAWLGRGNVFYELKRYDEASAAYDKALVLEPELAQGWLGRGNVFHGLKGYDEALVAYDKALGLEPELVKAWYGRGNALRELKRYDDAIEAYDRALVSKPDLPGAEGARLNTKMTLCDWTNFDTECANLISSVKNGKPNTWPFAFVAVSSSPGDQLQCAKLWVAEQFPQSQKVIWQGKPYAHDRIRIAYVSADFREHPVSFLIAGMLECHDRSRFDVAAVSLGPDDSSELSQRLKASFEHFIDARAFSDDQIANLIRSSEVDILVDLMGFTADSRMGIFARRPAPIQVSYLGYPGTTGAPYIDYILADRFVIPEAKRECYSENVVYLPDSFMANDSKRKISERLPRRSECNLPETGFVFCSFNNSYKIVPHVFDIWMRLLRKLDNSVLWLSNTNETAIRNLRREAESRGVDPGRLVFAQRVLLNEDHLARHQLADLFLDTLPYNAHTTASDALWAGLPVLTCPGQTFAGRVAASMLSAINLPELIATTPEAYEQMAIDLANDPEKLAVIKRTLAENRLTTPLFDTKLFTRHLEAAYTAICKRHQAGAPA